MMGHLGPRETTLFDLAERLSTLLQEDGRVVHALTQLLRQGRVRTRAGVPIRLAEIELSGPEPVLPGADAHTTRAATPPTGPEPTRA